MLAFTNFPTKMKSKLITISYLLIQPYLICAQWSFVGPNPIEGLSYSGLSFINDSTGFTTTVNVLSWPTVTTEILKTVDFGETWEVVYTHSVSDDNTPEQLTDVFFINAQIGWACGLNLPYILKTIDGGETWNQYSLWSEANFNVLKFYDENFGIALNGGDAIYTTDGGQNWVLKDSLIGYDVSFIDECDYIIVNGNNIKKNFDCILEYQIFPTSEDGGNPERTGYSVHVINQNNWTLGALGLSGFSSFSSIITTNNAGETFSYIDFPFGAGIKCFEFRNSMLGFASILNPGTMPCGIVKTENGGVTWHCQETPIYNDTFYYSFNDIAYPSESVCYGVTTSRIFRTTNGGGELGQEWTGLKESIAEQDNVSVYPNPTNDLLSISGLSLPISTIIKITDTTGRLVMSEYNKQQIDVGHLISGIYFIEVSTEESRAVLRFVKE